MKPTDRDAALVWDMLHACCETAEFLDGVTLAVFLGDRKLCLAVERCLEIVGEAGPASAHRCSVSDRAEVAVASPSRRRAMEQLVLMGRSWQ